MREDEANQVIGVRKERSQTLSEHHVTRKATTAGSNQFATATATFGSVTDRGSGKESA